MVSTIRNHAKDISSGIRRRETTGGRPMGHKIAAVRSMLRLFNLKVIQT
jgi:hypothetical protein